MAEDGSLAASLVRDREFRLRLLDGMEIFSASEHINITSDTEIDDEAELGQLAATTSRMDVARCGHVAGRTDMCLRFRSMRPRSPLGASTIPAPESPRHKRGR